MMQIYWVQLVGEPFLLERDGVKVEYGFYHNEYVVAWSKETAIVAAKAKTLKKFSNRSAEMIEGRPMTLRVDEIAPGAPLWGLLRNEGFVLFSPDSE